MPSYKTNLTGNHVILSGAKNLKFPGIGSVGEGKDFRPFTPFRVTEGGSGRGIS